ncbi:multidrug resistance protein A [Escherichia coli]|uniref:Multidrug resistance protein A n=1 Tax=Escherichia coli TaxID=562 RepID=A0A376VH50_ECOLX|nr:multidrug resistance protein A [Escherichia coli]
MRCKKIALAKAQSDYNRRVPLGNANLIGREELQHARDAVTSAQAQLDVAIQQYNANQAMILGTKLEDQPAVQQAATEVRNAWLALERTRIVSPMTGYVSRRAVQPGAQISPTTPLMAVVPATNMWVDANFKETQIANMRIGQPVTITTDIYGDDVKYTGKVVGLDMGQVARSHCFRRKMRLVTGSKSFSVCLFVLNWTRNSSSNTRCVSVCPRW